MRNDVKRDWGWADKYLPDIARILKENAVHFISVKIAPMADDLEKATDMVLTLEGGDVAVRIRRDNCSYRDLTIRAWRKGCNRTEIHKIRGGFARWYFYGWINQKGNLADWIIVDLNKMRNLNLFNERRTIRKNPDGHTGFVWYPAKELNHRGVLIAHSPTMGLSQQDFL